MAYGLTQSLHTIDASSQTVKRAENALYNFTGAGTLETWIKFDSFTGLTQDLMFNQATSGSFGGWRWYLNSAGTEIHFSSESTDKGVSWTPSADTWYHAAVTSDGSGNVKFYVNGAQQGTTQTGFTNPTYADVQEFHISGGDDVGSTGITGNFSLARVWNGEARSEANISGNMCNVLGATTNLSAEYTLDNVLTDNSGNGLTLTNVSTCTFEAETPSTCAAAASGRDARGLTLLGVG